ncbi:MAG: hypothetical protein J6A06_02550 [Fibrobacteraceae bacterium]|nr:hypothetical protein [Fibrobacteraceae bacterium]
MNNLDFTKLEILGKKYLQYAIVGLVFALIADKLNIMDLASSSLLDVLMFLLLGVFANGVGKKLASQFNLFHKGLEQEEKNFVSVSIIGMLSILLFFWLFFEMPWNIEKVSKISELKEFLDCFYAPIFLLVAFALTFAYYIFRNYKWYIIGILGILLIIGSIVLYNNF